MKKFYILLLAGLTLCGSGFARVNITSHGNPVENGSVIDVECLVEEYEQFYYTWDPELYISSTSADETVSVTLETASDNLSICWPMLCVDVPANKSFTVEGVATSTPKNMLVHFIYQFPEPHDFGAQLPTAEVKVKGSGSDLLAFTIRGLAPEDAGTSAVDADACKVAAVYDLLGRPSSLTAKGMKIVVYDDGTVLKLKTNN